MSEAATLVDVPMPQMGVSVTEGTLVEWRVAVGDAVEADQILCGIATDKVDTEVPCPVAGTVAEILVPEGETVAVGTPLARVAADVAPPPSGSLRERSASPPLAREPAVATRETAWRTKGERRPFSPVVRRMAQRYGLDLELVPGSGRNGRVTKKDVIAYLERAERPQTAPPLPVSEPASQDADGAWAAPPAVDGGQSAPLSRIRRSIARNMVRSKATAAHAHTWIEVDMTRIERRRRELGVTALPFVARATVEALRRHPSVNAWLHDDVRTVHRDVHLGIAVALDQEGLIVPVIHHAERLSVEGLAARIRDLAARARSGELVPDEVQGATFTITNPGRYGSLMAAPIINLPQVAILDLEAITKRPVVVTDAEGNDSFAIRSMSIFGLAWDHRAIDGALAAQFLATVRDNLQNWPEQTSTPGSSSSAPEFPAKGFKPL